MRSVRATTSLLLAASTIACTDAAAPTAPGTLDVRPVRQAVQEKGQGVLAVRGVFFWPCIGEFVQVELQRPFSYRTTVTPSGNVVYHDHFLRDGSSGTAVGLTSGTVWTQDRIVGAFNQIVHANEGELVSETVNAWWVSESAPSLHNQTFVHFRQTGGGTITVDRVEFRCTAR